MSMKRTLSKVKDSAKDLKNKREAKPIETIYAYNGITEDGRKVDDIKTRNADGLIEILIVDFV